jgi:hypothetical protein
VSAENRPNQGNVEVRAVKPDKNAPLTRKPIQEFREFVPGFDSLDRRGAVRPGSQKSDKPSARERLDVKHDTPI